MNESIKELVAIGASISARCQPCLEYHIQTAIELGITDDDIRQAVEIGRAVEKGAVAAVKKFSDAIVDEFTSAAQKADIPENRSEAAAEGPASSETVLKIYDPAMCCSSGVCGPSVDPVLAGFAGTLKSISGRPGIRVERFNLGQQPQAFVENPEVKSMLGNGGEKRLPFIFINDRLWLQGRYPSREELLQAMNIQTGPVLFPGPATPENSPCCGGEGCC